MKKFNKKDSFFVKVYNKWSILSSGFKSRFFSKKEIKKIQHDKKFEKSLLMSENMSINQNSLHSIKEDEDLLNIGFIESSTLCDENKKIDLQKFLEKDYEKTFFSPVKRKKKIKKIRKRKKHNSVFTKSRFLTN